MKNKKTLFKLSLTALMLIGQLCTFAATSFTVDGMRYTTTSDSEVKVVKLSSGYYTGDMVIPSTVTYNDVTYTVTSIDAAFNGSSNLTSVTIPNSVTLIGEDAFNHCTSLTSITIPNSVTSIDNCAFYGCTSLTSIILPNSVTSIGTEVFYGCTGLTSVTISNSVTSIYSYTFYGCKSLTSVTIPNSVTKIGNSAFQDCTGLTSVTIPNSVTIIENSAFSGCIGLTSVSIPNSVTSMGSYVFDNCTNLPVEGYLRYAGNYLIEVVDKTQTTYTIKEGTRFIGSNAFKNCTYLSSLKIPNSVISIGYYAFYGCSGMTSVTIPNSVTSIGDYAFYNCTGLTEVIVEIESPIRPFYRNTFYNAYTATLYVPNESVETYLYSSYWSNFSSIQPISLTLDQTSIERNTGDTQTLVATVVPASYASSLTWESSNPAVATVSSDGTVTAVGAGTATITASLPSGATATCAITVIPTGTDIALNGNITSESIAALNEFFTNNEVNSVDLTGATSIADGITIPVSGNCIIYIPAGTTIGNTENVVVNGVCDNFVISDGQTLAPITAFTATNATYERTNLDNAWGTVCLPYEVSSDDNVTYYTTGTISGDVLTLTSTETLSAGTPAIYKSRSENGGKYSLSANATNVNVVTSVQGESVTTDEITLVGSFEKTVIDDVKTDAANEYYYISGGKFMHATKKLTINPFRAYFTVPKSAAPSGGFSIAVGEDDVTAINALTGEGDTTVLGIYNIDGKPQSDLQSGLNIVKLSNGKTKKILIK